MFVGDVQRDRSARCLRSRIYQLREESLYLEDPEDLLIGFIVGITGDSMSHSLNSLKGVI